MTLSTWQLIVVAGLATIWAVVLGVPLLADLLRWWRSRPPAPPIDRRPARRPLVESPANVWRNRPRPIRSWRSQEPARKRLQAILACAMATTVAMFLAIALRGVYIQLLLVMVAVSLLTVVGGAFVGVADDEHPVDRLPFRRRGPADHETGADGERGDLVLPGLLGAAPLTGPDDVPTANPFASSDDDISIPSLADITEAFRSPDRSGFIFEPLNLDEARSEVVIPEAVAEELSAAESIDVPVDPELAAELGLSVGRDAPTEPTDAPGAPPGRRDVRFNAAPEAGSRQASARARRTKRSKARPIYIESVLDDEDHPDRAIND